LLLIEKRKALILESTTALDFASRIPKARKRSIGSDRDLLYPRIGRTIPL